MIRYVAMLPFDKLDTAILLGVRRGMPITIANEILGVQPMTGPVGQIHTLRVRYAETFSSAVAGDEALIKKDIRM